MKRSVLIHAGTHKTGTTSLQMLFTRNRAELLDRGIMYPETGIWAGATESDSHSNIAWELMGHALFDARSGTLDDLIDEIVASDCEKVLLSSEEFSCLFANPERLHQLKARLENSGFVPHVALTLRDVHEYAQSLYVTLASYAFEMSYAEYSELVATERKVTFRQNTYCFDYGLLIGTFAEAFGADAVTCIDYDPHDAVSPLLEAHDWFFEGALDGAELDLKCNTTMSRVEELQRRVAVRQERIDGLEAEILRLESELHGTNVTLDWFKSALAASRDSFGRRVLRALRSAMDRR